VHLAPSYREFPTTRGLLPRRCDLGEIRIGDVIPKLSSRMQRQCPRDNWPRGQFWYRCMTCTLVPTTSSVQIGSSSAVRRVSALVQRVSRYRAGEGGSGRAGAACSRGSPTSRAMSAPAGGTLIRPGVIRRFPCWMGGWQFPIQKFSRMSVTSVRARSRARRSSAGLSSWKSCEDDSLNWYCSRKMYLLLENRILCECTSSSWTSAVT